MKIHGEFIVEELNFKSVGRIIMRGAKIVRMELNYRDAVVSMERIIIFLVSSSFVTCRTILWLRNCDSRASKPSKSLGDRTWPKPHQPLTWLDFFSS
jgi:hypothetical protein